jgi:hypothetical protein
LLLTLHSFRADLGEARRDHAEGGNAFPKRGLRRLEHLRPGTTDDREVDRVGNLFDCAVSAHAGNRFARAIDRIGGPGEVRADDVAKELSADRAAAFRGPDDGDSCRCEERS